MKLIQMLCMPCASRARKSSREFPRRFSEKSGWSTGPGFAAALVVAGGVALCSQPASAVVIDATAGARPLLQPPANAIGRWGSNASAVAIGPNHILTTRHQDGSGATPALRQVVFNGVTYNSVSQTLFDPVGEKWDVRLVEIEQTNGSPANLTDFIPVYTPAVSESLVGQRVVLAAHGVKGVNETANGFEWGDPVGGQFNASGLAVGENRIDSVNTQNDNGFNGTPRFVADFDAPADTGRMLYETTVAPGDSGGGMLLYRYDQWWLVGLPNAVDQDAGGTLPEAFFGQNLFATDVTSLGAQIETAIGGGFTFPTPKPLPEPAGLAALGAMALALRRRR